MKKKILSAAKIECYNILVEWSMKRTLMMKWGKSYEEKEGYRDEEDEHRFIMYDLSEGTF